MGNIVRFRLKEIITPQQNTQKYRFWEEIKDVPSFEMIPSNEAQKVAEIVQNTGATVFL